MLSFKLGLNKVEASGLKLVSSSEETINSELTQKVYIFKNDTVKVTKTESIFQKRLAEHRMIVQNISKSQITINEISPVRFKLDKDENVIEYFKSSWGHEFSTNVENIDKDIIVENRAGRSSQETSPTIFIKKHRNYSFGLTVAWSGNHRISLVKGNDGAYLCAGINPWNFEKKLKPDETMDSMSVFVCYSEDGSLDSIANAFIEFSRKYLYPHNDITSQMLFEWNHWWAYEDKNVNEKNLLKNIDAAKEVGCELITLDAGWYGGTNELQWTETRGDWDSVNLAKFPSGIRYISDYVHGKNMKFGLWCEIEALGAKSELSRTNPEFAAMCDGKPLGYVCFGNKHVQEWAFNTLEKLILDYNLDWVKLDFNIDPMSGCNRTDHGHDAKDGLYEHYKGYYKVLDKIRKKYPDVVLENCSSGGLRTDLEMLRHTHCTFLSDVDVTDRKLNFLRGELTTIAPDICLNWCWSHSIVNEKGEGPFPPFNMANGNYKEHQIDYRLLGGMMGWSGISQRLEDFTAERKNIMSRYISIYKENIKKYVKDGIVYRISPDNLQDEISTFIMQYYIKQTGSSLIFVLNEKEKKNDVTFFAKNIDVNEKYKVAFININRELLISGEELSSNGIQCGLMEKEEARLIEIIPVTE